MNNSHCFALVGNPISHSLSPLIHQAFAKQFNLSINYQAIEFPLDGFVTRIRALQQKSFKGLNVTLPFKQQAAEICDDKKPLADKANAVNTISFQVKHGVPTIVGDNTDGTGLVRDLIHHHISVKEKNVLLLGAGGAVRGVLPALLTQNPASLTLANRTVEKAEQLATDFKDLGTIIPNTYTALGQHQFDLIINGTAAGLSQQLPPLPERVLGMHSVCYDMMYDIEKTTHFVQWAKDRGVSKAIDGLGMLIEQAAESFFIWHQLRADTSKVMNVLRKP